MPTFPSIDLSRFDVRELTDQIRAFQLPVVDLPKIDLPDIDLPKIDLPEVDTDRIVGFARDAAYVGIGLGVLAVQQTQVRRREAQARLESVQAEVGRRVRHVTASVV